MDVLEVTAKTTDEAIEKALDQLGLTREEVKITILSEGKSGSFFGIGAEEARVRVERLAPDIGNRADLSETAQQILENLLRLMEVDGTVVLSSSPPTGEEETGVPIVFNIEGEDLGILIGRRGQTLSALQYVLRIIVGQQSGSWVPIVVDAEGYKERRLEALRVLALRMADSVKTRGTPFTLEPMPAYERRIVHLALANDPAVFTESIGEGESRKVVIQPKQRSGPANNVPRRQVWNR